jgi:TPR repeat protein
MKRILSLLLMALIFSSVAIGQTNAQLEFQLTTRIYNSAMAQYHEAKYEEARENFELARSRGNSKAIHMLGLIFSEGLGVEEDKAKAFEYFGIASSKNIAESHYMLGLYFEKGLAVDVDYDKAFHYYTFAANKRVSDASRRLGNLHYLGRGTEKDHQKAYDCFKKEAVAGSGEAASNIATMIELGFAAPAGESSTAWLQTASDNGFGPASFRVAIHLQVGDTVEKDDALAHSYFLRALAQGVTDAHLELARQYRDGRGVDRSAANAVQHYRAAGLLQNEIALTELAVLFIEGEIVKRNIPQAKIYLEEAVEMGYTPAKDYLKKLNKKK